MPKGLAHNLGMTTEQFYARVREILNTRHPDARLSFMIRKHEGGPYYPITESGGRLLFDNRVPVAAEPARDWHLTVFLTPENKFSAQACGSVAVHPKAVQTQGPDFADRIGRQLAGMVSERRKP